MINIDVNLCLTVGELNNLVSTVVDSKTLSEQDIDYIVAKLLETRRDWQIKESKRLMVNMVSELNHFATNKDNLLSLLGLREELNILFQELRVKETLEFEASEALK